MHKSPLRSRKTILLRSAPQRTTLPTAELVSHLDNWLLDGEIRQHSASVRSTPRLLLSKLGWFLGSQNHAHCGTPELRQFLAYATRGHTEKGGRWGNPHLTPPLSPRTVKDYHAHLCTFFRWLVAEGCLDSSPMEAIPAPISRADQIRPFTEAQVKAILTAASRANVSIRRGLSKSFRSHCLWTRSTGHFPKKTATNEGTQQGGRMCRKVFLGFSPICDPSRNRGDPGRTLLVISTDCARCPISRRSA